MDEAEPKLQTSRSSISPRKGQSQPSTLPAYLNNTHENPPRTRAPITLAGLSSAETCLGTPAQAGPSPGTPPSLYVSGSGSKATPG